MKKITIFLILITISISVYAVYLSPWLVKAGYQSDLPLAAMSSESAEIETWGHNSTPAVRENVLAAGAMALNIAAPWLRGWRSSWGANPGDIIRYLPGDELINNPVWSYTRAITINTDHVSVWPWIVQIGQNRAGFYSYQGLENLLGCEITNANRPVSEFQSMRPGDEIYLHPELPPLQVSSLRRQHWFVLRSGEFRPGTNKTNESGKLTWTFYLQKIDHKTTRLLIRGRYFYSPALANKLSFGPLLLDPMTFVMEKKMLWTIKMLAENWRQQ